MSNYESFISGGGLAQMQADITNFNLIRAKQESSLSRPPKTTDNTSLGYSETSKWQYGGSIWTPYSMSSAYAVWVPVSTPAILPGDASPTKLSCCIGTVKLVSTYSGHAVDVEATVGGNTVTATFDFVGNELDRAVVSKFEAACDAGTYIRVTKAYDQSGNARDFTSQSGFNKLVLVWSIQQKRYVMSGFYGQSSQGGALANLSATFTGNNYSMVAIGESSNFADNQHYIAAVGTWAAGAGAYSCMQSSGGAGYTGSVVDNRNPTGGSKAPSVPTPPMCNPCVISQTCRSDRWKWTSNQNWNETSGTPAATAYTGVWAGSDGVASHVSGGVAAMRACAYLFFSTALTDTELGLLHSGSYSAYDIKPQLRNRLIISGDSRVNGAFQSRGLTIGNLLAALYPTVEVYSIGVGGQTQAASIPAQHPVIKGMVKSGMRTVCVSLESVNDFIVSNLSAQQSFDQSVTCRSDLVGAGVEFWKVSELNTTNTTNGANTKTPQYRTLLEASTIPFINIADVTPAVLASDATLYPDGLHPNETVCYTIATRIAEKLGTL
jgi:hypothetical protein